MILYTVWLLGEVEILSPLRYGIYLIPIVITYNAINTNRNFYDIKNTFPVLLLYIFILMLMPFGKAHYSVLTIRDGVIISGYLIVYVLAPPARLIHFKYLLYSTFAAFIFLFFYSGSNYQFVIFTSASTSGSYDGQESFLCLIYAFVFLQKAKKLESFLAIALCVLAGKRIALMGLCAGLLSILLFYYFRKTAKIAFCCLVFLISVTGIGFAFVVETAFNSLSFLQGYNIEEFMVGRYVMGSALSKSLFDQDFSTWIFGSSAGAADNFIISLAFDSGVTNAHDDWLKIFYDYGFAGYIIYLSIFFLIFRKNIWTMGLGVATSVVMVTDNVLIYFFFQFPLFLAVTALGDQSSETLPRKIYFRARSSAPLAG